MGRLTDIQEIRRLVLEAITPSPTGGYFTDAIKHILVQAGDQNRFLVMRTGWFQGENYYGVMQDVELTEGIVLIHRDGAEEELADDLVAAGIPADSIIKTYLAPEQRPNQQPLNA